MPVVGVEDARFLAVAAPALGARALGVPRDTSHPLTGMAFSLHRLGHLRRARAALTVGQAPRVWRVLRLQTWFWRANVLLLLVTVAARTVVRPGAEGSAGSPTGARVHS